MKRILLSFLIICCFSFLNLSSAKAGSADLPVNANAQQVGSYITLSSKNNQQVGQMRCYIEDGIYVLRVTCISSSLVVDHPYIHDLQQNTDFEQCYDLANIPKNKIEVVHVDEDLHFGNCESLFEGFTNCHAINFLASIEEDAIGSYMFKDCGSAVTKYSVYGLTGTTIVVRNSCLTNLKYIGTLFQGAKINEISNISNNAIDSWLPDIHGTSGGHEYWADEYGNTQGGGSIWRNFKGRLYPRQTHTVNVVYQEDYVTDNSFTRTLTFGNEKNVTADEIVSEATNSKNFESEFYFEHQDYFGYERSVDGYYICKSASPTDKLSGNVITDKSPTTTTVYLYTNKPTYNIDYFYDAHCKAGTAEKATSYNYSKYQTPFGNAVADNGYKVTCQYELVGVADRVYAPSEDQGKYYLRPHMGTYNINVRYTTTPIQYNITYDTNGGSEVTGTTTYNIETPVELPVSSKDGYEFAGWKSEDDTIYKTSLPIGLYGDINLTAQWELAKYKVTFDAEPGSISSSYVEYTYGRGLDSLPAPTPKEGYTFEGWYENEIKVTGIPTTAKGDKALKAKYTPNIYKITYKGIDGIKNDNPSTYTYSQGTVLKNVSKDNYSFDGWYLKGQKVTEISKTTLGDLELEAKFIPNTYKITYKDVPNGVTNSNPVNYTYGKDVSLKDLTQNGYTFDGWFDEKGNKVTSISATNTGDVVLTAKFTKIEEKRTTDTKAADTKATDTKTDAKSDTTDNTATTKYTITYKNVPKGISNPNPSSYTTGTAVTLKNLTYKGYTFKGWYLSSGKQLTIIPKTAKGNVTLSAKWAKNTTALPKVTGLKVTKGKKAVTVKYNKATGVSGYQIQYTLNGKTKTKLTTNTKVSLNKKAKNIKVRTVKKSNGKTTYGAWS